MIQQTAILIFTRTPECEAQKKQFIHHGDVVTNTIIASSLIRHTVETVKKSGIPFFTVYSDKQKGDCFGERLVNAMHLVFDAGFQNVIAIGNDCPALSASQLIQAKILLEKNEVVIGPSKDGGLYLLGVNKKYFIPEHLISLSWESDSMLRSLLTLLNSSCTKFRLLATKADVDDAAGLELFYRKYLVTDFYLAFIKSILSSSGRIYARVKKDMHASRSIRRFSFRSPPAFSA